jgi:hypothetical protein
VPTANVLPAIQAVTPVVTLVPIAITNKKWPVNIAKRGLEIFQIVSAAMLTVRNMKGMMAMIMTMRVKMMIKWAWETADPLLFLAK